MKPLIARLQPVLVAYILAGIVVGLLDVLVRGPLVGAADGRVGGLVVAAFLAAVVMAVVGALFGATAGGVIAAVTLLLQRPSESGSAADELRELLVRVFGEPNSSLRALIPAALLWGALDWVLRLAARSVGLNNIFEVVASAGAAVGAVLVAFAAMRLMSRRLAWLRMPLWGWPLFITLAAFRVVDQFWEYAQPYYMWPALLIVLTLGAVAMLAWLSRFSVSPRAQRPAAPLSAGTETRGTITSAGTATAAPLPPPAQSLAAPLLAGIVAAVAVLAGLAVVGFRSARGVRAARPRDSPQCAGNRRQWRRRELHRRGSRGVRAGGSGGGGGTSASRIPGRAKV